MKHFKYLVIGIFFGIVLTKSEVISWYRIQEMFRFQSFHMFGVITSALFTGIVVVQWIKFTKQKNVNGEVINFSDKKKSVSRYLFGGILFGLGWALSGACPGPMYILLGNGYSVFIVVILSALLGTWIYGLSRNKLPH